MGRPFSSALEMKQVATPANPPAGSTLLYVKSDGLVYAKSSAGVETAVSGGGGTPAGAEVDLNSDWTTSNPSTPSSGLTLFSRQRGRRLLTIKDPQGQDTHLQPALFSNYTARWLAVNNVATPYTEGLAVTNIQTPTAVSNAVTNFYASLVRSRFTSAASNASGAGFRSTNPQWFLSSTSRLGGFFFSCRFGINTGVNANRGFFGFSTTTTQLAANTNPTDYTSMVGFGWNSNVTTIQFLCNDSSGTASPVDLGANFPVGTGNNATNFYEVQMYSPAGGGSVVYWSARRLNDNAYASGTASSNLPALDTLMSAHVNISTGSSSSAVALDVQSLYVESDN